MRLSILPRQKPSSRRLNPLVQKQYLVGEVGENCLYQVQSRDPIFQKMGPFVINLENLSDLN